MRVRSISGLSRLGRITLSMLLCAGLVLSASLAFAAPVSGTNTTYTSDADFAQGTLLNVHYDAPTSNQLQLYSVTEPFPFVNIAASGRGTMIRINTETGAIVGEYWTAPDGRGRDPSRTTVDQLGNVWVANRAEGSFSGGEQKGSITRIGLITGGTRVNASGTLDPAGEYLQPPFAYNTCVDRDGDGLIRTSRGLLNILPWLNAGGADHNGGVTQAQDECIINYTRTIGTNARTVAIDANNDVWVGGTNSRHEKLSGVTGQPVPGTQKNFACGGYGGLIDRQGILWSARFGSGLLRYDPASGTAQCHGNDMGDYGMGLSPVTGHIWHSALSGNSNGLRIYEFNSSGTVLNSYQQPFGAQGVAIDGNDHVWMAEIFGSRIWHLAPDPASPGQHITVGIVTGLQGVTGVAVDKNGKIWAAEFYNSRTSRIDPNAGPLGGGGYTVGQIDLSVSLGYGAWPYNYSDMTGFVLGATSPQGSWSVVQDSGAAGFEWGKVTWNTEAEGSVQPVGTVIEVAARSADNEAALSSQTFTAVSNGAPFSLTGRYIEVRVVMKANGDNESPILSDITIAAANAPPEVSLDDQSMNEGDTVTLTANASDPDGDPLTYAWSLLSGGGVLTPSGSTATYFNDDGPDAAVIAVTVDDGKGGEATAQATVTVHNVAPTVDAGSDQSEYWGLLVSLTGTVTDPSQADTTAGLNPTWDFGDGSATASGASTSHTYANPGGYTATLTAMDKDGGVGEDETQVTITKRETGLAYTGDSSAVFGFAATLSAQLSDAVDAGTAQLMGQTITFTVDGQSITATTDANGVATAPAPVLLMPGTHVVDVAYAEGGHYLASSAQGSLTVGNSIGKITAGALRSPSNGSSGFNVHSDAAGLKGQVQYQDKTVKFHASIITAVGISADGTKAWFAGTGTKGESFVAYVEDNGEPGRTDKFQLWINGTLYTGDGTLLGGNIQIHQ